MFKSQFFIFMMIILVKSEGDEDTLKKLEDKIDAENAKFGDSERRFIDSLNDAEWHVAHLKSTDFENTRRVGADNCKEETFAQKVRRYRKSLKEDAGRIDFVRALPLPVDDKDLDEFKCIPKDNNEGNVTIKNNTVNKTEFAQNKTIVSKTVTSKTDVGEATVEVEGIVTVTDSDENTSVTPISNKVFKPHIQNQATTRIPSEIMKEKDGRRGDYLFSSVEYDEDVDIHFDENECPGVVDVIVLEQDTIRTYDVECELNLQWQSYYE